MRSNVARKYMALCLRQRFLRDAKKTCKANKNVEIMDARSPKFDESRPESLESKRDGVIVVLTRKG
jgi:hypothetical protein